MKCWLGISVGVNVESDSRLELLRDIAVRIRESLKSDGDYLLSTASIEYGLTADEKRQVVRFLASMV